MDVVKARGHSVAWRTNSLALRVRKPQFMPQNYTPLPTSLRSAPACEISSDAARESRVGDFASNAEHPLGVALSDILLVRGECNYMCISAGGQEVILHQVDRYLRTVISQRMSSCSKRSSFCSEPSSRYKLSKAVGHGLDTFTIFV